MFFDADTHVDECEATWKYFPSSQKHLVPRTINFEKDQLPAWWPEGHERKWFIDGQVYARRLRPTGLTGTSADIRELRDVPARLKDMDRLGVDVQVLYPTLFLAEVTLKPELDVALCQSYNRWIADRCAESNGRLRFVAMIPYTSMHDAVAELRWAKNAGAIGAFKRAFEAGDRSVHDPYFYEAYAVAADLDMPLCLHAASPWQPVAHAVSSVRVNMLGAVLNINACHSWIMAKLPERFPGLRIGCIEAGSAWLPFLFGELEAQGARGASLAVLPDRSKGPLWADRMAECRMFITVEVQEDLPYLIANVGDGQLMSSTDYGHEDRSAVMRALSIVAERTDLSPTSRAALTRENALRFYGLSEATALAGGMLRSA